MLIVIVIIGILAAALIPRLSSARGRANDVARKADLAQTAAALVSYQIDHGSFPATAWSLSWISTELISAWMSSIPEDPSSSRAFSGIVWWIMGQYSYSPIYKWGIQDNGFVLMAWTETEWWSNWIVASGMPVISSTSPTTSSYEIISNNLCKSFTSSTSCTEPRDSAGVCCYNKTADQLRYIYLY